MDNNTPNMNPNPAPVSNPTPVPAKEGAGPVVGIILILLIIVLGGLYFWSKRAQAPTDSMNQVSTEEMVNEISATSNSDDTASLEADLNNTNTDLNADLEAIQ